MAAVSAVLSGEAKVPFRCSRILQLAGAASLAIETPELDDEQQPCRGPTLRSLSTPSNSVRRGTPLKSTILELVDFGEKL